MRGCLLLLVCASLLVVHSTVSAQSTCASITCADNSNSASNMASAFGVNNKATGHAATAFGEDSSATGDYSVAIGYNAVAHGSSAIALGNYADAGNDTLAIGDSMTLSAKTIDNVDLSVANGITVANTITLTAEQIAPDGRTDSVGNLGSYIVDLKFQIADLKQSMTDMTDAISALQSDMSKVQADITANTDSISTLNADLKPDGTNYILPSQGTTRKYQLYIQDDGNVISYNTAKNTKCWTSFTTISSNCGK